MVHKRRCLVMEWRPSLRLFSPCSPRLHSLAASFTLGAPQSTTSICLTMHDYVSNYPKDFSSRLGKQLWAAAEGEEEMCRIDGEKYESRAQRNTLGIFFGPISFCQNLSLSTHGKQLAIAKITTEKFWKILRNPWHVQWSILGLSGVCQHIFMVENWFSQIFPV